MLYLEQFILAFEQSKKLSVSRISISWIFAYIEQIFQSLEQFFLVISDFSQNFQNFSCSFSPQISFFFNTHSHKCCNFTGKNK